MAIGVGVGVITAVGVGVGVATGARVGVDVEAGPPLQALRTTNMARTDRTASQGIRKGVTAAAWAVGASAVYILLTGLWNARAGIPPRSLLRASISLGVRLWSIIAPSNSY